MPLSRTAQFVRWVAVVLGGLIALVAAADSYTSASYDRTWMPQALDAALLMVACTGFISKKRYGPVTFFILACIKTGVFLNSATNPYALFGGLVGLVVPLFFAAFLFKAFRPYTQVRDTSSNIS